MQDHRQIVAFRQFQLFVEKPLLPLKLRIVAEEIQTDLPTATTFAGRLSSACCS